jgi:hypothetical protein
LIPGRRDRCFNNFFGHRFNFRDSLWKDPFSLEAATSRPGFTSVVSLTVLRAGGSRGRNVTTRLVARWASA